MVLAAGADRRHRPFYDVHRRGLRGDDRNGLQPHGDGQGHPCRVLRERPRHGGRARHLLRKLQCVAGALRGSYCHHYVPAAEIRAPVLQEGRQPGKRTGDQVHPARAVPARRAGNDRQKRSSVARLSHWDDSGPLLSEGQGPCRADAYDHLYALHAVLLHQGWRLGEGPDRLSRLQD